MENELKQLIKLEGEKMTITSADLCKLINILRREEKGKEAKELAHFNLMISIKSEIETLKSLGISPLNFQESTYVNPRGKVYPCFILNDESMLQMLNKESAIVRCKTTELIKELKEENVRLQQQLQKEVIECKYIHSERKFIHLICVYTYLSNGKDRLINKLIGVIDNGK